MRTNQAYINEYSFFDQLFECLENVNTEVSSAVATYEYAQRQMELKSFFEDVMDEEPVVEAGGVLEAIGKGVLKLINSITECIRGITDKIFGTTDKVKSDKEKVTKILAEHPEFKNDVCEGIQKEWFTYKDVVQYEKDIVGLTNMLKQHKIDHETFIDKMKRATDKFNESGKMITSSFKTISNVLSIIPDMGKKAHEVKGTLQNLSDTLNDFKENVEKNYSEKDMNTVQATFNALGTAVGLVTKESQACTRSYTGVSGILHTFANSKVGKAFKVDDASRDARHNKAYDDRQDRLDREKEEYYRKTELTMKDKAEHQKRMEEIANRVKGNNP